LTALSDPSDDVRSSAASALRNAVDQPQVINALLTALSDPNEAVRNTVAYSITFSDRLEAPSLFLLLENVDKFIAYRAVQKFNSIYPQPENLNRLLNLLKNEKETVKSAALFAILNLAKHPNAFIQPEIIQQIRSFFDDPGFNSSGESVHNCTENNYETWNGLYHNLFAILAIVAPGPIVK
jgi:HEAT repeat protein